MTAPGLETATERDNHLWATAVRIWQLQFAVAFRSLRSEPREDVIRRWTQEEADRKKRGGAARIVLVLRDLTDLRQADLWWVNVYARLYRGRIRFIRLEDLAGRGDRHGFAVFEEKNDRTTTFEVHKYELYPVSGPEGLVWDVRHIEVMPDVPKTRVASYKAAFSRLFRLGVAPAAIQAMLLGLAERGSVAELHERYQAAQAAYHWSRDEATRMSAAMISKGGGLHLAHAERGTTVVGTRGPGTKLACPKCGLQGYPEWKEIRHIRYLYLRHPYRDAQGKLRKTSHYVGSGASLPR